MHACMYEIQQTKPKNVGPQDAEQEATLAARRTKSVLATLRRKINREPEEGNWMKLAS